MVTILSGVRADLTPSHGPALALGTGAVTLLAVAGGLLLLAVGWRLVQALAVRRRIRQTLTDTDPEVRRHGIELATDRGLGWSADMLLDLAVTEQDPAVLAALVHAVARRQWEPASSARIVELRLWAKAYVDAHQELRPQREQAVEPVEPAGLARRASDATEADLAAMAATAATTATAATAARVAGEPGARVLVTGAGGAAGVAVIRDLLRHGHHVVAVDADESAVGLRLAHESHVLPRADDDTYAAELAKAVAVSQPQALICTVAEEYAALVAAVPALAEAGVATMLPPLEAALACIDKWRFAQLAAEKGLPVPATALGAREGVPGPWVVKPRYGRGSRDVHVVIKARGLSAAIAATPDPVVQSLVQGREFTADALVDRDGAVAAVSPRWRLETKAGISTKGQTFDDPAVVAAVEQVLAALGLVGPANVQGFVSADGGVTVHEVNPRFSGGLPLTLHAGAEVVEEYLRAILGRPMRRERLVAKPGVAMYRHWAEVFEG
ncbi:MAG: ATP-grasp domain-containing protein [Frankiaceae bacterium]